jgi:hypothetical protein
VIPGRGKRFSLLYSVQNSSGVHPASYLNGTAGFSSVVKWVGRAADHPPPSNAEVKNGGAIPPLPHTLLESCAYLAYFTLPTAHIPY